MKIFRFNPWVVLVFQAFFSLFKTLFMKRSINLLATSLLFSLIALVSCKKQIGNGSTLQKDEWQSTAANQINGHLKQTKTFSSEVAQKWLELQVRMLRLPAGPNIYGRNGHRYFIYSGLALYES